MADMTSYVGVLGAGGLFGAGAAAFLLLCGRIAGIGGIAAQALEARGAERTWRLCFLGGLLAGGALIARLDPTAVRPTHWVSLPWLLVAALLVGVGARRANGCTSGHGVCGVGRLSPRSIVAVAIFSGAGIVAQALIRTMGGGQ